jgi:hypothetical protein
VLDLKAKVIAVNADELLRDIEGVLPIKNSQLHALPISRQIIESPGDLFGNLD